MKKKLVLITFCSLLSVAAFNFWEASKTAPSALTPKVEPLGEQVAPKSQKKGKFTAELQERIDKLLGRVGEMWDPTGRKVKVIEIKMEELDKALESQDPDLAESILREIEIILSEK